jgi:IclR family mhp operon transcriptional activator
MAKLENRSLDRGITVLKILSREGACSLADLNRHSQIPKSSIRRLLGTLRHRRLIRQSVSDKKYRINFDLPVSTGQSVDANVAYLVDIALPHLLELTEKVKCPSDLHVVYGEKMRIIDSTRPLSPFHLYRGQINRQLNIFGSASGMACMANSAIDEVREIHRRTANDPVWGLKRSDMNFQSYLKIVNQTRALGYGTRLNKYLGETVLDDSLAAIAIPILRGKKPVGAVTLLWPRILMEHRQFASQYLQELLKTVDLVNNSVLNMEA